jgi:hypothetical protein
MWSTACSDAPASIQTKERARLVSHGYASKHASKASLTSHFHNIKRRFPNPSVISPSRPLPNLSPPPN